MTDIQGDDYSSPDEPVEPTEPSGSTESVETMEDEWGVIDESPTPRYHAPDWLTDNPLFNVNIYRELRTIREGYDNNRLNMAFIALIGLSTVIFLVISVFQQALSPGSGLIPVLIFLGIFGLLTAAAITSFVGLIKRRQWGIVVGIVLTSILMLASIAFPPNICLNMFFFISLVVALNRNGKAMTALKRRGLNTSPKRLDTYLRQIVLNGKMQFGMPDTVHIEPGSRADILEDYLIRQLPGGALSRKKPDVHKAESFRSAIRVFFFFSSLFRYQILQTVIVSGILISVAIRFNGPHIAMLVVGYLILCFIPMFFLRRHVRGYMEFSKLLMSLNIIIFFFLIVIGVNKSGFMLSALALFLLMIPSFIAIWKFSQSLRTLKTFKFRNPQKTFEEFSLIQCMIAGFLKYFDQYDEDGW